MKKPDEAIIGDLLYSELEEGVNDKVDSQISKIVLSPPKPTVNMV